ncbi:ABC transporter permease [Taklimakanibacter deserti]|uniref:ABC transporter permease n=1 Tax=Taklimakanibacter deserti TaxID=2267839 RepID=UPI000E65353B
MRPKLTMQGWRLFIFLVIAFLVTPLILVILFSFNSSALTSLPLTGFTFDWYRRLFANESFWPALTNSLIIGFTVAVLSVVVGTLAALALVRFKPKGADRLMALLSAPMMMPALIIGIALLVFFKRLLDVPLGLPTVILGHLVIIQPFVIAILHARLATFDWSLVESARDLGASPLRAFATITLPIIQPTIVGAALIALSISLDDFVITFLTIGAGNTLPTMVWGLVRTSLDPTINALATLLLVLSIGSTIVALSVSRYRG